MLEWQACSKSIVANKRSNTRFSFNFVSTSRLVLVCIEVFSDPDPDSPPRLLVSYICLFSDQTIAWTSWDCAMTQQIGPGFWIYYVFTVSDCNKKHRMTYVWENDNELKWIAASPGTHSLLVHKLHAQNAFLFTVRVTFDLLILSW